MTTIRAEIRKWHLRDADGIVVWGKIYKDTAEIYDDGEEVVFIGVKNIQETATYFLVEADSGIYKLEKEEQA